MSSRKVPVDLDPEWVRAGATLKALREGRGLTVGQLSAKADLSYAYLSNIEAGRKRLTPRLAVRFADLLAVPPAALLAPQHFGATVPPFPQPSGSGATGAIGGAPTGDGSPTDRRTL